VPEQESKLTHLLRILKVQIKSTVV
jgi:hypothetical protein